MTPQQQVDAVFRRFVSGDLSRVDYVDELNHLFDGWPTSVRKDLAGRTDDRSFGDFCLDVYDDTMWERFLAREWVKLLDEAGVRLEDNGVANDGRPVLRTLGETAEPDFLMYYGGRVCKLEIKVAPHCPCVTYKRFLLESYASDPGTLVLTVRGGKRPRSTLVFELPPDLTWILMDRDEVLAVLERGEHGRHRGFGNKPTVRVYEADFAGLFEVHQWGV